MSGDDITDGQAKREGVAPNPRASLSIFANFKIDSVERLHRMKDSFESFEEASIVAWVVNARGAFAEEALKFLSDRLGRKLILFCLASRKGWFHDSRQMLPFIRTTHVLFWIEDHICLCGPAMLDAVVAQMAESGAEYLEYSWFGQGGLLREFDSIERTETTDLVTLVFDKGANAARQRNCMKMFGRNVYIISCCAVFSRTLFERILTTRHPIVRRAPRETPFDFEKRWDDESFLPIRFGIPKRELFAAIDDDNLFPGDSLFSRGLYPQRVPRREMLEVREGEKRFAGVRRILKRSRLAQKLYGYLKRLGYQF